MLVFLAAACLSGCTSGEAREMSAENREFVLAIGYAFDDLYEIRTLGVPSDQTSLADFGSRARASVESASSRVERYLDEPTTAQAPVAERVRFALASMREGVGAFQRSTVHPTDAGLANAKVGFSEGRKALMDAAILLDPVAPSKLGGTPHESGFILTKTDARDAAERLNRLVERRVGEMMESDPEVELGDLPIEVLAVATLAATMELHADGKPN